MPLNPIAERGCVVPRPASGASSGKVVEVNLPRRQTRGENENKRELLSPFRRAELNFNSSLKHKLRRARQLDIFKFAVFFLETDFQNIAALHLNFHRRAKLMRA